MSGTIRSLLIVSPNKSVSEALRAAIVAFAPGTEVHLSPDARDALWTAADVRPNTMIVDYNEESTRPLMLIQKLDLFDENVRIIVLMDGESQEYVTGLDAKLRAELRDREVTIVPFEDFVTNIRLYLEPAYGAMT